MSISVTDPIGQAINRAKFITFQQFDPAYVIIKEPPPPAFPVIDVPR